MRFPVQWQNAVVLPTPIGFYDRKPMDQSLFQKWMDDIEKFRQNWDNILDHWDAVNELDSSSYRDTMSGMWHFWGYQVFSKLGLIVEQDKWRPSEQEVHPDEGYDYPIGPIPFTRFGDPVSKIPLTQMMESMSQYLENNTFVKNPSQFIDVGMKTVLKAYGYSPEQAIGVVTLGLSLGLIGSVSSLGGVPGANSTQEPCAPYCDPMGAGPRNPMYGDPCLCPPDVGRFQGPFNTLAFITAALGILSNMRVEIIPSYGTMNTEEKDRYRGYQLPEWPES